jgi:hypothetical protein
MAVDLKSEKSIHLPDNLAIVIKIHSLEELSRFRSLRRIVNTIL